MSATLNVLGVVPMITDELDTHRIRFGERTGRGIRIAIVDTGIDATHPAVGEVRAGVRLQRTRDGQVSIDTDYHDDFGHGTACAGIVRKRAEACELLAVKVSSGTDPISPQVLAAGIDWATEHGADVINVSAGTTGADGAVALTEPCARAAAKGVVIVASESNDGQTSWPAALKGVLAVGGEATERDVYAYRCDSQEPRRLAAYGGYQKVAWLKPRFLFISGVSFAAARISAIVALVLEHDRRLVHTDLLRVLRYNSANQASKAWSELTGEALPYPAPRAIDWIRRAAIYPYSKEMHSLVRFRHLLPFQLVGVADAVARGWVGKDAGTVINAASTGLIVTSQLEEALAQADTLILGFTTRLGELQGRNLGADLAERAFALGKNVYSFEPLGVADAGSLLLRAARQGLQFAWPGVGDLDLEELRRAGRTPVSLASTPILGVFGTSPSQGKFTLQLVLKERLQALGLNVGQIGSEHQSRLFGMDDCFPIGHLNNVSLQGKYWREYFNLQYQRIARERKPDMIIVGSQGGVVPYSLTDTRGPGSLTFMNLLYAMAVRADSCILVVNHLDKPQFVKDTIDALRIVGKCRTILLALSTRRRHVVTSFGRRMVTVESVDPGEQADHLRKLEEAFQLPAVSILDEQDQERLVNTVVAAYSAK